MSDQNIPPLGLPPRHIWEGLTHDADPFAVDERRYEDISAAIERYEEEDKPVPPEWHEESEELLSKWDLLDKTCRLRWEERT